MANPLAAPSDEQLAARRRWLAYCARHPAEHQTERKRKWRHANPENTKAARKRYTLTEAGKASLRKSALKRRYNLTPEQRDEMVAAQGGACAVCLVALPDTKKQRVDHCHTTGKVRGILCHHCNIALGHMRDNTDTLRAAIKYLEASK